MQWHACRLRPSRTMTRIMAAFALALAAWPASAQMVSPPVAAPTSVAAPQQTPPGIATVPSGMVPPVAATSAMPTADAKVAPVKRVAPKTPALPTVVARAIAKAKQVKVGARPATAASQRLAAPMALGVKSTATATACQPGEIFVRRTGICQKRGVPLVKKASTAPKRAVAKSKSVASRTRAKT